METLLQDLRYGFRMLARNPGFTAVIVLSLGLGLGANTTIFSFINALLLRPPAIESPGEVLEISETRRGELRTLSMPSYLYYRDHSRTFSGILAAAIIPKAAAWVRPEQTELVYAHVVSANYFSVLGVRPALGRGFLPAEDDAEGKSPVVVLADSFWRRRLGADPAIIGKNLTINRHSFTVVGVAPSYFTGTQPFKPDFWAPLSVLEEIGWSGASRTSWTHAWIYAAGRLQKGVRPSQAQAELNVLAGQLEQSSPNANKGWGVALSPVSLAPRFVRNVVAGFGGLLMAVVVLVLLVACANAAGLLTVRASQQRRETAIRSALGASRLRLMRQALTESILFSCLGGVVALLMTFWTSSLLLSLKPSIAMFPIEFDVPVDSGVVAFTLLLSILTGVVFGIVPAARSSRFVPAAALKEEASGGGQRRSRFRSLLVVAQLAVSLVLLLGAGLCLKSLLNAWSIDKGFETRNRFLASFDLENVGYSRAQGEEFHRRLIERVEALPGVLAVGLADELPLGATKSDVEVFAEGQDTATKEQAITVSNRIVGPRYFQVMGTPLLRGREFGPQDRADSPKVVVINEVMARQFWPGRDPLGQRLTVIEGGKRTSLEVVGVAKTGKYLSLGESPVPFMYRCLAQEYRPAATMVVRAVTDPRLLMTAVRREFQQLEPNLALNQLCTLDEYVKLSLFLARITSVLLGASGLLAVLLALAGVYSITAFDVAQRTREIGIRMALGARRMDVMGLVMRRGLLLTSAGLVIGLAGAFALTRFLSYLLYGLSPTDPVTFVVVAVLLAAVSMLAGYIPARRATRVDPMLALRYE
ncbi:MAG TPA: ABC transporter permease [Terriglobia bacterium]|nr:ABC transporter permease [Terriglobia bacterium]